MAEERMGDVDAREVLEKVVQYRKFLHERLVPDLNDAVEQRSKLEEEIEDWKGLEASISTPTGEETALVDLGAGVFAEGRVHDPRTMYVSIGLGFFVQCSAEEGLGMARERVQILQERKLKAEDSITSIQGSISLVTQGIEELKRL
ncbi:prefoldin subunit [Chloropicon primus]|uniref:Prefoldin n=1 Tax=Chloropicon primus TaxID=1764295 RepID=A0A5B8ML81_9CHLO|nr:hypothetical protein A3770_05p38960 [Chloropicon primus]UPR00593.1 prefoldin subunit [Chloropicon primus]|mmetsp:Transcript_7035/g.20548  ORF Transcript_7035/g.20548 Transcript_7035/m.20548 type:complete len:146 (+) Transcript_7035:232-669(+)|eukprot:QDZ21378.1 hypothetical protein A3770_05p38960 [Chloropicon primus]